MDWRVDRYRQMAQLGALRLGADLELARQRQAARRSALIAFSAAAGFLLVSIVAGMLGV